MRISISPLYVGYYYSRGVVLNRCRSLKIAVSRSIVDRFKVVVDRFKVLFDRFRPF